MQPRELPMQFPYFLDKYGIIKRKQAFGSVSMKKFFCIMIALILCSSLFACSENTANPEIVATTYPVAQFTSALCVNTELTVGQLITENISCLHDYSLQARQMQILESSELVVISGAGLEDFIDDDLLENKNILDSSIGISLLCADDTQSQHNTDHQHEQDSHIWLSIENASVMAQNICNGLKRAYPEYTAVFEKNLEKLQLQFQELALYAETQLKSLSCRKIITFHDGFSYMAQEFQLEILRAIEEESGSEASAKELIELIDLINEHKIPAIFTESNGSTAAAEIISSQTGLKNYPLDTAMAHLDYFSAMKHNIDTLKEALG